MAAAYALSVVLRRNGRWLVYDLYYNLPIVVPFVLFLLHRARTRGELGARRIAIDVAVVALAASRVVLPVPGISGHTLFLTHAMRTTGGVARAAAVLVFLEVTVIKLALWHDLSWGGGLVIGLLSARAWRFVSRPWALPGPPSSPLPPRAGTGG